MKNKISIIALASLGLLICGCDDGGSSITKLTENIKPIIKYNAVDEDTESNSVQIRNIETLLDLDTQVTRYYLQSGLLEVKTLPTIDTPAKYGVYSLVKNEFIIPLSELNNFSIKEDFYSGFGIVIQSGTYENNFLRIYDALDNVLVSSTTERFENFHVNKQFIRDDNHKIVKEILNVEIHTYDEMTGSKKYNFYYDGQTKKDGEYEEKTTDDLSIGSNISNKKYDLTLINLPGYEASINSSMISIFKDGNLVSKYENFLNDVDFNDSYYNCYDGVFINQKITPVTKYDTDFDVYLPMHNETDEVSKARLNTYKIDLLTGKKEEVEIPFIFNGYRTYPIKGESQNYEYGYASGNYINANKTLGETKTFVFNKNFEVVSKNQTVDYSDLIQVGTNYLDTYHLTIYDDEDKAITSFEDYDFNGYNKQLNAISTIYDDKMLVITDPNGIITKTYDLRGKQFNVSDSFDNIFVKDGGTFTLLNKYTAQVQKSIVDIITEFNLDNSLVRAFVNPQGIHFISKSGSYVRIPSDFTTTEAPHMINSGNNYFSGNLYAFNYNNDTYYISTKSTLNDYYN